MILKPKVITAGVSLFFFALLLQSMFSCAPKDTRTPAERGRAFYVSYCQICHGDDGSGAMASLLKVEPPDLTRISIRHGGTFPVEEVKKVIDGREEEKVAGHTVRDMPIFGETFQQSEDIHREKDVERVIDDLVAYLELIQKQ